MLDDAFVRLVQAELKTRGFYDGPIDGIAGTGTVASLLKALGPAPETVEPPAVAPVLALTGATGAWDARSARNLIGVHKDLVKVFNLARQRSEVRFVIIEGVRTLERQKQLYAQGASKTLNSRHIPGADGLAKAMDFAPIGSNGQIAFDWPLYWKVGPVIEAAAKELGVAVVWGARWSTFKDGPHVELDRKVYP